MKTFKFILLYLIIVVAHSCSDYLDVNSESKFTDEYIFNDKEEINRALNTVYAMLLSNNTYGNHYFNTYALNSDVEFSAYSNIIPNPNGSDYRCFEANRNGSHLANTWKDAYSCIEYANIFVYGLSNSPIFDSQDTELLQQLNEAKVLRAMNYHDLIVLFGDIPFSFTPSYHAESLVMPVVDRTEIYNTLIEDLAKAAPGLSFASDMSDGVERVSKEFCWALICRMALTAGGYSLRPDKNNPSNIGTMERPENYRDYYEIAKTYADSVISSGRHSLNKPFNQVFIDQCNYIVDNADDPIFEIPFLKNGNGQVGYYHGPQGQTLEDVTTGLNVWGASNGGARLNAFYRFSFDEKDVRRDFSVGMWYYNHEGIPSIRNDYTTHCNKWSKFWATPGNSLGVNSKEDTGINFPYMRYADVLLMYAEAINELENGVTGANGANAIDAFKQVRRRGFAQEDYAEKVDNYVAANTSKEKFFELIFNERKWEFAGENLRWKDLVRWNKYSQVAYDVFMEYYAVACVDNNDSQYDPDGKYDNLPTTIFYRVVDNPNDINKYPNTTLPILDIYNPFSVSAPPTGEGWSGTNPITNNEILQIAYFYDWADDNGILKAQPCYSMRGYIYGDENGNIVTNISPGNLPPVRYILPYPNSAIQRSNGVYKNYYGYN